MEPSSPSRRSSTRRGREKFLRRVIWPAIRGQSCPICFDELYDRSSAVLSSCKHAYCYECIRKWSFLRRKCPLCIADFDSWFYRICLSTGNFHKQRLLPLNDRSRNLCFREEEQRTRRIVIDRERTRSRQFPWRRSFGRPEDVGSDVILERKLRWRSSIYEKGFRAVPISPRNHLQQSTLCNNGVKEFFLQRIEPWIRRELQAILEDPDPSIIVHVAASLFIASLEKDLDISSRQPEVGHNFLAPLCPFLLDKTDTFWHELRCFAESSFNMETYDAVVEYRQMD